MKLINKRTGDIWEFDEGFSMKASHETAEKAGAGSGVLTCYAYSLAELNEEWEDYKPAEPLIKDEKIRKAVRAWADAEEIGVVCYKVPDTFESIDGASKIEFCVFGFEEGQYTIAELCGEEEE